MRITLIVGTQTSIGSIYPDKTPWLVFYIMFSMLISFTHGRMRYRYEYVPARSILTEFNEILLYNLRFITFVLLSQISIRIIKKQKKKLKIKKRYLQNIYSLTVQKLEKFEILVNILVLQYSRIPFMWICRRTNIIFRSHNRSLRSDK